jgi:hypothetical protein
VVPRQEGQDLEHYHRRHRYRHRRESSTARYDMLPQLAGYDLRLPQLRVVGVLLPSCDLWLVADGLCSSDNPQKRKVVPS